MITLVLESSTYAGSVALLDDAVLLGERSVAMRGREHEALMPAVADLLAECGFGPEHIQRVVCGAGPGSFTSLRIAASIAKGIAFSVAATLVPVSSLALLVASVDPFMPGRYLACVGAMRGESYVQLFEADADLLVTQKGELDLVSSAGVNAMAHEQSATAVGPECSGVAAVYPHARSATRITNMIDAAPATDLASWEPRYGRLAEAQVKWEADHGRPLTSA